VHALLSDGLARTLSLDECLLASSLNLHGESKAAKMHASVSVTAFAVAGEVRTLMSFYRHVRTPKDQRPQEMCRQRSLSIRASAYILKLHRTSILDQLKAGEITVDEAHRHTDALKRKHFWKRINPPGNSGIMFGFLNRAYGFFSRGILFHEQTKWRLVSCYTDQNR
jgi:hypothetical protein